MKKISLKIYVVFMFLWIPLCVLMEFGVSYSIFVILFFVTFLVNIIMGIITTKKLYQLKKFNRLNHQPPC